MDLEVLRQIRELKAQKCPLVVVTDVSDGAQEVLAYPSGAAAPPQSRYGAEVSAAGREALRLDRSRMVESEGRSVFVHAINPPLRMAIIGAVHIAQALAPMGAMLGYEVNVIDPRRAFASDARFPGIRLIGEWPDDGLEALAPDVRTAIVTLTHDPKLDDPALHIALRSPAFYVGCLGSRRTHASRVDRLVEAGFDKTDIDRIKGPIGLNIGARSPAEIAASIIGEITAELRLGADE